MKKTKLDCEDCGNSFTRSKVMNKVVGKDDDSEDDDSNQIMSSCDWVNELDFDAV
jgi:hypothetical protein